MLLIVGLGNPEREYESTRHNAGWHFLDYLTTLPGSDFEEWKEKKKLNALVSEGSMNFQTLKLSDFQTSVILAKPLTFMNNSGLAVQKLTTHYSLTTNHLLIVHDDIDIPFGEYKLQINRGSAGHHGVESIISYLGTRNFTRIRIGISPKKSFDERVKQAKAMDHVLKRFSKTELKQLEEIFQKIYKDLVNYSFVKNIV